jgi:integrase
MGVCTGRFLAKSVQGKITKASVDALARGEILADTEVKGFVVRRLPSGVITYGLRYRANGRQRWLALGVHGRITPAKARRFAKKAAGAVADHRDPVHERETERTKAEAAKSRTLDVLLDAFVERYVRKNELRTAGEIERTFDKYVRPRIGAKSIYELRRRDVVEMLDAIESEHGPVMADRTLGRLRKAMNWWATRDDEFVPPLVIGMARTKNAERARRRVLDDQEIRDLWEALDEADAPPCYPAYVRALLLTAQRRTEVAHMRWQEIEGNTWIIPAERYKTNLENIVPLTEMALEMLGKPRKSGFVFTTTGGTKPFSGFSKARVGLNEAVAKLRKERRRQPIQPWVLHDLRRTARSLMSRAGVSADIAERVLGHKIAGVRGVYDRYEYIAEKRDALERLAALLSKILESPECNVVPLAARG